VKVTQVFPVGGYSGYSVEVTQVPPVEVTQVIPMEGNAHRVAKEAAQVRALIF